MGKQKRNKKSKISKKVSLQKSGHSFVKTKLLPLLLLVLLSLILFAQTTRFEFVNLDDTLHLRDNPHVASADISRLPDIWSSSYKLLYIPMLYSSWLIIGSMSETGKGARDVYSKNPDGSFSYSPVPAFDPALFHTANFLFHTLNGILVFLILGLLLPNSSVWSRFLGAAFWLSHPSMAEPVSWISGFKDVFSGSFIFLTILFGLLYAHRGVFKKPSSNIGSLLIFNLVFILAVFSKPSAVTIPVLLFFCLILLFEFDYKKALSGLWPTFLLAAISTVATIVIHEGAVYRYRTPLFERPVVMLDSLVIYLKNALLPYAPTLDYGRAPVLVLEQSWYLFTLPFLMVLLLLLWHFGKKYQVLFLASLFFFVPILPNTGITTFIFQTVSTIADRYMYICILGPAILVCYISGLRPFQKPYALWASVFVVLLFSAKTATLVPRWKDSATLWNYTLEINPRSWLAMNNRAIIHEIKGENQQATELFLKSASFYPRADALERAGALLIEAGAFAKGIEILEKAEILAPENPRLPHNIGVAYEQLGERKKAMDSYLKALQISPEFMMSKNALQKLMASGGIKF